MKHSPVFKAMFESGMRETTTNVLVISDFTVDVVELFAFLFVFEHEVCNIFDFSNLDLLFDLLAFSKKYDVTFLSNDLEKVTIEVISSDNIWTLFKFADIHACEMLKEGIIDFLLEE
jgi:hypothetical protein